MRKNLKTVWGATLVGMAGLVASAIVSGAAEKAEAGDKRQSGPSARQAPVAYASDHQSVIRISNRDPLPVSKGIRLGRNKSVVVELPRDLRDVVVSAPDTNGRNFRLVLRSSDSEPLATLTQLS